MKKIEPNISGTIPPDVMASLKSMDVKLTDVSVYARRAHNENFSNVYLQKVIGEFPERRKFAVEKIVAEFVCMIYYIQDVYGLSSLRRQGQIVKQIIETFPNPDRELREYIQKRLISVYESLWLAPYPEEGRIPGKKKKSSTGQKGPG